MAEEAFIASAFHVPVASTFITLELGTLQTATTHTVHCTSRAAISHFFRFPAPISTAIRGAFETKMIVL